MTLGKIFLGVNRNFLLHSHYEYVRTMVRGLELPTDEFYVRNFQHGDMSSTAISAYALLSGGEEYYQTMIPFRANSLNYLFQSHRMLEDRTVKSEYITYNILGRLTDSYEIQNIRKFYEEYMVSHGKSEYIERYVNDYEKGSKYIESWKTQKREDSKLLLSILDDVV